MTRARPADLASRALVFFAELALRFETGDVERLAQLAERPRRLGAAGGSEETLECPLVDPDAVADGPVLELRRIELRHAGQVERAFRLIDQAIDDLEHLG